MKKTIITMLFALVALMGQAQELRVNEPTLDDYLQLLKAQGYIAYSFDMKDFKDKSVEPVIMEYVDGKEPTAGLRPILSMIISKQTAGSTAAMSEKPLTEMTSSCFRVIPFPLRRHRVRWTV